MESRTSKKSEKVTKEQFYGKRNYIWFKRMKGISNAMLGELKLRIVGTVDSSTTVKGKTYVRDFKTSPLGIGLLHIPEKERLKGRCVICGRNHAKEFPEGFPDEWKMCCFCKNTAEAIVEDIYLLDYISSYKRAKLEKLINLVG